MARTRPSVDDIDENVRSAAVKVAHDLDHVPYATSWLYGPTPDVAMAVQVRILGPLCADR